MRSAMEGVAAEIVTEEAGRSRGVVRDELCKEGDGRGETPLIPRRRKDDGQPDTPARRRALPESKEARTPRTDPTDPPAVSGLPLDRGTDPTDPAPGRHTRTAQAAGSQGLSLSFPLSLLSFPFLLFLPRLEDRLFFRPPAAPAAGEFCRLLFFQCLSAQSLSSLQT